MLKSGPDLAGGRPGDKLKLGLTKTMINNTQQPSRSVVARNTIIETHPN